MLSQMQIIKLSIVMMLSNLLLNYQVVAGLPFVIPRIDRHSVQAQRLIKEVQGIDFHADKVSSPASLSNRANTVQGRMVSDQELLSQRPDCAPGLRDNLSFRLCCESNQSSSLTGWCSSTNPLIFTKKEKLANGRGRVGSRVQQQLLDEMNLQDQKARITLLVETLLNELRHRRSIGSNNHDYS